MRWLLVPLLISAIPLPANSLPERFRSAPGEVAVLSYTDLSEGIAKSRNSSFREIIDLSPSNRTTKKKEPIGKKRPRFYLFKGDQSVPVGELVEAAKQIPGVAIAEPNYLGNLAYVPSDDLYPQTADHFGCAGFEEAWDIQRGAESVVVAVIDSGVDGNHGDLKEVLHSASYNFVDMNDEVFDDFAHGTRVAGIIGAMEGSETPDNTGIVGGAFGCQILSLDVVDSEGNVSAIHTAAAIMEAVAQGAQIINLSLSFHSNSQNLKFACDEASKSALLFASAGNENQGDTPVYPASFDSVIGVGATTLDCVTRAPFSNYNRLETNLVELVAPGQNIFTTVPGSVYDGVYTSGTSFACPIVASVAALMQAKYPTQSPLGIRNHLRETAVPLGAWAGYGKVSAKDALDTDLEPKLTVASVVVDDSTAYGMGNDEDGQWDRGETVRLTVNLKNDGLDVSGLSATLSSSDPDVTVDEAAGAWPAILSGDTKSSTDTFQVTAAPDALSHAATMTLTFTAKGLPPDAITFSTEIDNIETPPNIIAGDTTWTSD
ncbi:MAG: S8 family serine peptidase, partial [Candidatus Omnitrophica bacterium]|nr:S8 family serine peptidase [Candidatus Omnitrophota bacterium]